MGPEKCKNCGQLQKPSFTEWFCPRCTTLEKDDYSCEHGINTKKKPCHYCMEDLFKSEASYSADMKVSAPVIRGRKMTHWLQCHHCKGIVFYMDHNPALPQYEHEGICEVNGYFQKNYMTTNGSPIHCDSCHIRVYQMLHIDIRSY